MRRLSGQTESLNIYRLESLGLWVLPAGTHHGESFGTDAIRPAFILDGSAEKHGLTGSSSILLRCCRWRTQASCPGWRTEFCWSREKALPRSSSCNAAWRPRKVKAAGSIGERSANAAHSDYYQRYSSSFGCASQSKKRPEGKRPAFFLVPHFPHPSFEIRTNLQAGKRRGSLRPATVKQHLRSRPW